MKLLNTELNRLKKFSFIKNKPLEKDNLPIQIEEVKPERRIKVNIEEEENIANMNKETTEEDIVYIGFLINKYPTPTDLHFNNLVKTYPLLNELKERLDLKIGLM